MVFEQKNISHETLGEYLKAVRKSLGLTVVMVAGSIGIAPKFLEALEDGRFTMLPADVYVLGFLVKLAKLYEIPEGELVDQYKRERAALGKVVHGRSRGGLKRAISAIAITPRFLSLGVGTIVIGIMVGYIIWQVATINSAPKLEVFEPTEGQVIKQSVVNVSGKTEPGTHVTINGQEVFVSSNGEFKTQLGISPGQKELIFKAHNKFDSVVTKTISVVAEGEQVANQIANVEQQKVNLELEFSKRVSIEYVVDGGDAEKEDFTPGTNRRIVAEREVKLTVSDAGAVHVVLNGKILGVLGKNGERLERVPFTADINSLESPVPTTATTTTGTKP